MTEKKQPKAMTAPEYVNHLEEVGPIGLPESDLKLFQKFKGVNKDLKVAQQKRTYLKQEFDKVQNEMLVLQGKGRQLGELLHENACDRGEVFNPPTPQEAIQGLTSEGGIEGDDAKVTNLKEYGIPEGAADKDKAAS